MPRRVWPFQSSGGLLFALIVLLAPLETGRAASVAGQEPTLNHAPHPSAALPLAFEPNAGQSAAPVRFLAHAPGATFFFTPGEMVLVLKPGQAAGGGDGGQPGPPASPQVVHVQFVGANAVDHLTGDEALPGRVNYLRGSDRAQWHTNLPTYAMITYHGLYPGMDLRYTGTNGQLKSTYTLAPGTNPAPIRWRYTGVDCLTLDALGNLQITLPPRLGPDGHLLAPVTITEQAPRAWQEIGGQQPAVAARFTLAPDGSVGFALGRYDQSRPLIIDPAFVYSTYLGGSSNDQGLAIAASAAGEAFATGTTYSSDFPMANPYQPTFHGNRDVYVTKLNPAGSALVYSTYIGGTCADEAYGIAVDAAGNAYLTGITCSSDYPLQNAFQPTWRGGVWDAFVTKLNAAGDALVYSTFLGGTLSEEAYGIAVDSAGRATVVGYTHSLDFPLQNPFQPTVSGVWDAFVTRFTPAGTALVYSTYLGGSGYERARAVAVDGAGNAFVTGETDSTNFPTQNAYQATNHGFYDAYVAEFNPTGSALIYSTYLGGTNYDQANGIAVDGAGGAYITGQTTSYNFPTQNAYQPTLRGPQDAFVAHFAPNGATLAYATYLGGANDDLARGIAVDGGSAIVVGETGSADFPQVEPLLPYYAGGTTDVFVTKFAAGGTALLHSTFLGGGLADQGFGVAVDGGGQVYVTGQTVSPDYPRAYPIQPNYGGGFVDAFVTKLNPLPTTPTPTITGTPYTPTNTRTITNTPHSTPTPTGRCFGASGPEIPCPTQTPTFTHTPTITGTPPTSTPTPCPPSWLLQAPYPSPIKDQAMVVQGGKLYSFGGQSQALGNEISSAYVYDPNSNAWTPISDLPAPRRGASAVSDGRVIYIINGWGGGPTNTVFRYDPVLNTYSILPPLTIPTSYQAAAYLNGRIYRLGGCTSSSLCAATDTVETGAGLVAPLPQPLFGHMAAALEGYLYVGGGNNGTVAKTYRYDPTSNTWDDAAIADLPQIRAAAASGVLGGRWVLAGGMSSGGFSNSTIAWDPPSNTWRNLTPLTLARAFLAGGAIEPAFYAVGGGDPSTNWPTTDTQQYQPTGCPTPPVPPTTTRTASPTATHTAPAPASLTPLTTPTPTARTASPTPCAADFTDVPATSTFYTWIHCLACAGIVGGYPCGGPGEPCPGQYYRPNNNVTRGQVSKIVSESAQFADPVPSAQQTFEDVPPGSTFWVWIERLAGRGIIGGYPCGGPFEPCIAPANRPYFRPNNNVTRGQIAKITSGAAGWTETPTGQTFEDVPPGTPFYLWVERLAGRAIISGYPCGSVGEPCIAPDNRPYFRPSNPATRGQMSKIAASTFFPACPTPARR